MQNELPPVINNCCLYATCWAENNTDPYTKWFGACYGEIEIIDEVIDEDYGDDWWDWIHGCQGHINRFGDYIPYIKD